MGKQENFVVQDKSFFSFCIYTESDRADGEQPMKDLAKYTEAVRPDRA